MRISAASIIGLVALAGPACAAEPLATVPSKASAALLPWSGFYAGAHLGYAWGGSDWSATGAVGPPLAGSLNLINSFDAFSGAGSYLLGFQGGYNLMLPSRLVLGVEADLSFPNTVAGTALMASPGVGIASFSEAVEMSGTVRGRIGYAFGQWLAYATSGFAWTHDRFTRVQLLGMAAGGAAMAGANERRAATRTGFAAGAGVEFPLAPHWTGKLEYLYTGFDSRAEAFALSAQRFNSDLAVQSLRLGLNYQLDSQFDPSKGFPALDTDRWSVHGQATYLNQYDFPFRSPYTGRNSLIPNSGRETWDVTVYAGLRLWDGAELWVNPEIDQGFGLSNTLGVAGFPSGEAYKVGDSYPYARVPRMFVRQTFDLGGDVQKIDPSLNQFSGSQTANRLVVTVGKFAVTDVFDANKYAHDPRTDFMNWAVVDAGTFDYAADAWGYTYGATAEWYSGAWTLRGGLFDLSTVPNSTSLDSRFDQFQSVGEIEHRHNLWGQPGKIAVTGFLSRGRMGSYNDAVVQAVLNGGPADISTVRRYRSRNGVSANVEQQLLDGVGLFVRAGLASPDVEPYEFSDIDRTLAAGLSLNGKAWGRPDDTFGLAGVVNSVSGAHQAFLNAGGLGILVGDGLLPNPGSEQIVETYYSFPVSFWKVTLDYQYITNPAYNRDRGPVSVIGARIRTQF